ncbi:MAG: KpsF/GutQ family sugar-phosphate isomerase [Halieaceae bacterium]|nr:KpsF/GutQ family sugar-phosphate isomerase [Halieaceae bacterium]
MSAIDHPDYLEFARRTVRMERDAISRLLERMDDSFSRACEILMATTGRVVVTGMGKSGHIACKIASTLASTGTPAMFVHPAEASHGDLGMITAQDSVIALSNSGATSEVVTLLPLLKRMGVPLITMTGVADSVLARAADVNINAAVSEEACPLDLAPTSSTTVCLVAGDAMAIALLEARGFSAEDFAFSHPGGSLGRRLLLKVDDIMHRGQALPAVLSGVTLDKALLEVSSKGLGMTSVVDENGTLLGVFTDGDLRRALDDEIDIHRTPIDQVMTRGCITIAADILAAEALHIMDENKISALVVVDAEQHPKGAVHLHDLLKAGVA